MAIESAGASACVVSLIGELDLSTIARVEKQLLEQVHSKKGVVVDLTKLSFIDSSGIALLIQASRAADDGCTLNTVIEAGSQVDRVFRLAGVDQALPLFTQRLPALEALDGAVSD
jgi:anti-anti-sigma factor